MHRKAATRRQRVRRTLARVFAGWRTGLPGPVLVLSAGTAVNYFGTGLILPFEIIYLHQARGFPTATAGLVLAAVMGTAAVVTLPAGALLDRFRAKPILITGNLASALGYAAFAFVDRPWQAFVCAAVGGAGFGLASTANQVLTLTLVSAEHRASSIALGRVAGNFGLGSGATVAGFIVAFAHDLRAFQALYLFDGVTFAVFALVVLVGIPNPRLATAASASGRRKRFPSGCSRSALPRLDRRQRRACDGRRRILFQHPRAICDGAHACRAGRDRRRLLHQHLLRRRRADSSHTGRQADAPHTRSRRDQRALCNRPARGPARNAHELDAHCYHRLGRGRDRDRDR